MQTDDEAAETPMVAESRNIPEDTPTVETLVQNLFSAITQPPIPPPANPPNGRQPTFLPTVLQGMREGANAAVDDIFGFLGELIN